MGFEVLGSVCSGLFLCSVFCDVFLGVWGFGLLGLGFGVRGEVLSFEFWVLCCGSRVLGLEFQVLALRLQILEFTI